MIHKTAMLLPPLLMLNGCAYIDAIGAKFISLTNPVAMSGLVIGVDPPDDEKINEILAEAELPLGTAVTLMVANAAGFTDIEAAVVRDAKVSILEEDIELQNESATGVYVLSPAEGLEWIPGNRWTINVELKDRPNPGKVKIKLPQSIRAELPSTVELGEKLTFDLKGQGFDFAVAAIFDLNGEVIYDSKPTEIKEIVELITRTDPVEDLVIPKNAFPREGLYLMGIAGLNETGDHNLTDLNSALSKFFFGQMKLVPIAVGSPVVANALLLGTAPPPPELAAAVDAAGYGAGTSMTLSAIDVTQFGDPILDATVDLEGVLAVDLDDSGVYTIDLADGPIYRPGVEWTVHVDHPDLERATVLRQLMPFPPEPGIPAQHPVNQPLIVDVGPEFTTAVVVVLGDNGEVLFSNEAEGDDAILALLEDDTAAEPVTVPGSVFAEVGGVRAVGVAGLARADVEDFDSVVADFSMMLAGQMQFFPLAITP